MLRLQSAAAPAEVRHTIVDSLDRSVSSIHVASAYVTFGGTTILFKCLSEFLTQEKINTVPKVLVAALDFGITEPEALRCWRMMPNTQVHVAGAELLDTGSLIPAAAFHPKVYAFGKPRHRANMVTGSANLTSRGFSINTEAVWAEQDVRLSVVNDMFATLSAQTVPLTDRILEAYRRLRRRAPPPRELRTEAERVPRPRAVKPRDLRAFRDAVESRQVDPAAYREMWIQVDALQGGSGNQLELPRGAHRFFGFVFKDYTFPDKKTIGVPHLQAGARSWTDRLLTWHGNNQMERINLPTRAQGGFAYEDSAIMFRRIGQNAFELIVASWDSDLARSWRDASTKNNLVFRLGEKTHRLVGLI